MGIRRRGFGAGLAGLGEGLSLLAQDRVRKRQLEDQQAFEIQKLKLGELGKLQDTLAQHPDQVPFTLDSAAANPLLQGMDLSPYRHAAQSQGIRSLSNLVNTAKSPDDLPADLGAALTARTGATYPSAQPGNAADFGAQADYPDLPPELNAILNLASARRGQLTEKKATDLEDVGRKKFAETYAGKSAEGSAAHDYAPTAMADKVAEETALGPVQATNAGLKTGAEFDATNTPARQSAAARGAGMKMSAEERAKLQAQLQATGLTAQQQTGALNLADNFRQESAPFRVQETNFRTILSSAKDPSAAGDLSVIFAYMKLLDPQSSVREGEYATAQNVGSIPQRVWSQYNAAVTGQKLAPEVRNDFVKRAFGIYTAAKGSQDRIVNDYTNRAVMLGVPPPLVVRPTDPALDKAPEVNAPIAGGPTSKYDLKANPRR